jgi:CDP-glucose 4,6-dehydratase
MSRTSIHFGERNQNGKYGKHMNIFVTGGMGLVGGHLVEALVRRKERVIVLFRSQDPHSYFYQQKLDKKVVLVSGDLKDYFRMYDILTKYEIDIVLHLGAQPIVTTAYNNPLETFNTNIIGTANILEACRQKGNLNAIIVASSDKAYGKSKQSYRETDPLSGDHPYESSKSCADLIAQTYIKTYHMPIVIARFGNIYGPGDYNFSRIIPGIMKSIITKRRLELRSDGSFVRDYVYVKDVVKGYLFLLDHIKKTKGEAWNLSSENSMSVIELIHVSEKILRKKIPYKILHIAKNEIPYQHLDYSKIKKIGWKPIYTLKKGLEETYAFYCTMHKNLFVS